MEPQTEPNLSQAPPPPPPVVPPPVVPPKPPRTFGIERFLPYFIALAAISMGVIIFVILQKVFQKPAEPGPTTIIVTPTPNPTPIREMTNVSTTSAFMEFEQTLGAFQRDLSAFNKDDPSLSPPSLVLPLGFSN